MSEVVECCRCGCALQRMSDRCYVAGKTCCEQCCSMVQRKEYGLNYRTAIAPLSWVAAKEAAAEVVDSGARDCTRQIPLMDIEYDKQAMWAVSGLLTAASVAIRALPGPTDAQLLAAALAVPQIKALVDAMKPFEADAVMSDVPALIRAINGIRIALTAIEEAAK